MVPTCTQLLSPSLDMSLLKAQALRPQHKPSQSNIHGWRWHLHESTEETCQSCRQTRRPSSCLVCRVLPPSSCPYGSIRCPACRAAEPAARAESPNLGSRGALPSSNTWSACEVLLPKQARIHARHAGGFCAHREPKLCRSGVASSARPALRTHTVQASHARAPSDIACSNAGICCRAPACAEEALHKALKQNGGAFGICHVGCCQSPGYTSAERPPAVTSKGLRHTLALAQHLNAAARPCAPRPCSNLGTRGATCSVLVDAIVQGRGASRTRLRGLKMLNMWESWSPSNPKCAGLQLGRSKNKKRRMKEKSKAKIFRSFLQVQDKSLQSSRSETIKAHLCSLVSGRRRPHLGSWTPP